MKLAIDAENGFHAQYAYALRQKLENFTPLAEDCDENRMFLAKTQGAQTKFGGFGGCRTSARSVTFDLWRETFFALDFETH
jgi:hypothetical protein